MKAKFLALAALVLGLASCQTDTINGVKVDANGEAPVTIQVGLPEEATRAAGVDSALGAIDNEVDMDEYDIRFILEVYDERGALAKERQVVSGNETTATFSLRLVPGRHYSFVAWADFVNQGSQDDLHYNTHGGDGDTLGLTKVELKSGDAQNLNDETRDAYTGVFNTKDNNGEVFSSSTVVNFKLTRPFAKLRVVTNDMNQLYSELTEATVAYETPVYTSFNALSEEPGGAARLASKTVEYNTDTTYTNESNSGQMTLFADYLFGTSEDVISFTLDVEDKTGFDIPTVNFNTSIPVQRNHLTTIYGPVLTDANNVTVTIDEDFEGENSVNRVSNDVEKALKQNHKNIYVELEDDVAVNGNGVKWGGEDTELIVIDGKKLATNAATGALTGNHTLTFTTTYRLHIETVNPDAKVILRNLNVTTNKESGTWDTYDIQFNCNVDIENVNFQKAIAFVKDGQSVSIKNVTISETHDYYAMWISAVGQTVNIDNLVVNSAGRGIKIDEEYLDASEVAKVTLNINNAKFTTAKKAAIVVKSVAGADITLSNIDITGVAADAKNAVWVDEDAEDYFDKVNVIGGSMAIEGKDTIEGEDAQADFADAVQEENAVVQLSAGEYTIPTNIAEGVTIICQQGTVFNNPAKMNLNGATVIGAKFNSDNGGIVNNGQVNGTFKNCVFEGKKNLLRYGYAGKTCVFEDCYFKDNGNGYVFHFDSVATGLTNAEIICRRCTFEGGMVALGSTITVEMENCEFINCSDINTYGNTTFNNCNFNDTKSVCPLGKHAIYNGCTYKGEALAFDALDLYAGYDCKISIDDVDFAIASTVANLENYVNNATRDINVYITRTLTSTDATLVQKENVDVYITSYDGKKFFSGATLYIHGGSRSDGAETMTFENIHFSSFATRDLISSNETTSAERYAHNLTFKNCFFEGDAGIDVVGLRLRQVYNITIENCETRNLHSLGQVSSVEGITVKNTTINALRGFNLLNKADNAVFEGVTINATKEDGYGIRVDAAADGEVTIKNSTIIAYEPIVLRNAQAGFVLNLEGDNTITATGDYQLVINGETPILNGADGLTNNL